MSIQMHEVGVAADLTVEVPRDRMGDLTDGVRQALRRVDDVRDVEAVDVTGLTPRLNDLQAEVEAELTVAVDGADAADDADAATEALQAGFGVDVERMAVERPPP
jgi:transcriptional regulator of aromatic amino acid metabolism